MAEPATAVMQGIRIGPVVLKNRLGLGPINPGFAQPGDHQSESRIVDFYNQYAVNDIGLVYVGGVAVDLDARANSHSLTMRDPADAQILRSIVQAVELEGSLLAVQLMHAGRQASGREIGARTIAASPIACEVVQEVPAQASLADLNRIVRSFGTAARWSSYAGAKLIEIHAAHGYLISGFLSPSSNLRTDNYGGSVYNRFRLLRQIVAEVRDATTAAVGLRVNVAENAGSASLTLCDLTEGLMPIRNEIDFISVSGGVYTRGEDWIIPSRSLGPALWRRQARLIRNTVGKPVFLAGNIDNLELADGLIDEQAADVVLMVRALLADPTIVRKWFDRHTMTQPQPCTELLLCKYHSRGATNVYCPHNPVLRLRFRPKVGDKSSTNRSRRAAEPSAVRSAPADVA